MCQASRSDCSIENINFLFPGTGKNSSFPHFLVNSRCISPFYGEIKHWSVQRGTKKKSYSQVYDNGNGHVFFCGSEAELEKADRRFRLYN
jgi:hypothetical protein